MRSVRATWKPHFVLNSMLHTVRAKGSLRVAVFVKAIELTSATRSRELSQTPAHINLHDRYIYVRHVITLRPAAHWERSFATLKGTASAELGPAAHASDS